MNSKIALIVSIKFHPGHISHLVASYKQMEELGYKPYYWVNERSADYLPTDSNVIVDGTSLPPQINVVIFAFPHPKNIFEMIKFKLCKKAKIIYIFHEPLTKLSVYKEAGFGFMQMLKLRLGLLMDALMVLISDNVLLPSKKAVQYYQENRFYYNKNYIYIPLLYSDERTEMHKLRVREYFSYIGTIASDHSFNEYVEFVEWAVTNNKLAGVDFLVGTKSEFEVPEELQNSKRVTIKKGKPMTDEEINAYYSSTIAVWNAYTRTTQSGVLAKSFMFGTPALVMRQNLNEFTHDGENVVAIDDNTNFEQIEAAVMKIRDNFEAFSSSCRREFEKSFYYKVYNEQFRRIINDEK